MASLTVDERSNPSDPDAPNNSTPSSRTSARNRENGHGAEDTADFVALSGLLGLGQAELSGIERKHVELNAGTIQVFRRKTRQAFVIPVYPMARPILSEGWPLLPGAVCPDCASRQLPESFGSVLQAPRTAEL